MVSQIVSVIKTEIGLMCHLVEHGIAGDVLVALDHGTLQDMGMSSVGHRLTLLRAVYELKMEEGLEIGEDEWRPPGMEFWRRQERCDEELILLTVNRNTRSRPSGGRETAGDRTAATWVVCDGREQPLMSCDVEERLSLIERDHDLLRAALEERGISVPYAQYASEETLSGSISKQPNELERSNSYKWRDFKESDNAGPAPVGQLVAYDLNESLIMS